RLTVLEPGVRNEDDVAGPREAIAELRSLRFAAHLAGRRKTARVAGDLERAHLLELVLENAQPGLGVAHTDERLQVRVVDDHTAEPLLAGTQLTSRLGRDDRVLDRRSGHRWEELADRRRGQRRLLNDGLVLLDESGLGGRYADGVELGHVQE